jgi:hypothetical protein
MLPSRASAAFGPLPSPLFLFSLPAPLPLWDSGKFLIWQEFQEGHFGLWQVAENEPPCLGLLAPRAAGSL